MSDHVGVVEGTPFGGMESDVMVDAIAGMPGRIGITVSQFPAPYEEGRLYRPEETPAVGAILTADAARELAGLLQEAIKAAEETE